LEKFKLKQWFQEDDASSSGCSNVKDFETDCDDNIGVHLLAEVATGISLGVEEKEEHGMEKSKLKRSLWSWELSEQSAEQCLIQYYSMFSNSLVHLLVL